MAIMNDYSGLAAQASLVDQLKAAEEKKYLEQQAIGPRVRRSEMIAGILNVIHGSMNPCPIYQKCEPEIEEFCGKIRAICKEYL